MTEPRRAREDSFSGITFARYLAVLVAMFCPDVDLVVETCREIMRGMDPESKIPVREALRMTIRGQVAALGRLRARRQAPLRMDRLFQDHVRPFIEEGAEEYGWEVLCLTLRQLDKPCCALIIDYYLRDRDEALVPDHWSVRARCITKLRAALSERLRA